MDKQLTIQEMILQIDNRINSLRRTGLAAGMSVSATKVRHKYVLPLMKIKSQLEDIASLDDIIQECSEDCVPVLPEQKQQ